MDEKSDFNADNFVNYLLTEGDNFYCDDTAENFNEFEKLPPFYDEDKFKRGQNFYHDNIMAMFFGKLLGLIINLALPKTVHILKLTQMSNTPLTAYRRYLSTIFHMCIWYDKDFHPGSILWKSIQSVKCKHNIASRRGCRAGLGQLTQKDMALAQFGFMGFILVRSRAIGIHGARTEQLDAFVHVWRVVGRLFGIEDRNRDICNTVLTHILRPEMAKLDRGFLDLSAALITGMWAMNPVLEPSVFLAYIERMLNHNDFPIKPLAAATLVDRSLLVNGGQLTCPPDDRLTCQCRGESVSCSIKGNTLIRLSFWRRLHLYFVLLVIYSLKFTLVRLILNWHHYFVLWLMRNCPFLAYKEFGRKNAHVAIFKS